MKSRGADFAARTREIRRLMLLRTIGFQVMVGGIAIVFTGCVPDAPRDNPLDPQSPSYRNSTNVTGTVSTFYPPYQPIPDALVSIAQSSSSEGHLAALTDQNGSFSINGLPQGEYLLVAKKVGFAADTVRVTVELGKQNRADFHLDALPTFSNISATTSHIAQWWPGPIFQAEFAVSVSDADGASDIDSVILSVDSLIHAMSYSLLDRRFHATLKAEELPGGSLEWLIGKQIFILARDRAGNISSSSPIFVTRIINETPVAVSPSGLDTASARPTLRWEAVYMAYSFTFDVAVVRIDAGLPTTVWKQSNIPNTVTSTNVTDSLLSGTYYWTVAIVDDYGNRSRSREASFVVP